LNKNKLISVTKIKKEAVMKYLTIFLLIISLFGLGLTGCSGCLTNTQKGAVIGGALGTVSGAIIGNNWHNKHHDTVRNGAIIGGITGALGGAVIGTQMGN